MATKIRGVTIQLDGDTSGLNKALQSTNKEIKDTQSQLKDVDRLLKLDPKNTELLAQKQELLAKAIGESKTKLEQLKQAEEQMRSQGVDENSDQFMALRREIIATEQNLEKLTDETKNTKSGFDKVATAADKVAKAADNVAKKTKVLSAAGAALAGGLLATGYSSIKSADELRTLSARTGVSTDMLQKFAYASEMVDVSTEELAGALKKMKIQLGKAPEDFEALGIAVYNTDGSFRDLEDIFFDSLGVLSQIGNETERDLVSMDLFGKSADNLATIIDDGGEALRMYGEKAQELGLILSEDTLVKLTETGDKIDETKAQFTATMAEVGATLLEDLAPTLETIIGYVQELFEWLGSLDSETLNTILTVALVVAAISPVASLIAGISTAIGGVSQALNFLMAHPIVALIAAVTALVVAIALWGDEIQEILQGVDDFLQEIFVKDWEEEFGFLGTLLNYFLITVKAVWDAICQVFNGVIDFIRGVFTGDWDRAFGGLQDIATAGLTFIESIFDGLARFLEDVFAKDWTENFGVLGHVLNAFFFVVETVFNSVREVFGGIVRFVKGVFSGDWKEAFNGLGDIVKGALNLIENLFNGLADFLSGIFAKDWTETFGVLGHGLNAFFAIVDGVFNAVREIFGGIMKFVRGVFAGDWESAWEGIKDIFKGVFDALVSIAKAPLNLVIGILNTLIDGLNGLIGGINKISFDVPDWVPFIGGKKFGFNLGYIGHVAYLAKGGVLTAGSAIVGENGPEMLTMKGDRAVVQPLTQTTNKNYGGVTLNIYGAAGQNVQELAQIIMDEMGDATRRQEAAWA